MKGFSIQTTSPKVRFTKNTLVCSTIVFNRAASRGDSSRSVQDGGTPTRRRNQQTSPESRYFPGGTRFSGRRPSNLREPDRTGAQVSYSHRHSQAHPCARLLGRRTCRRGRKEIEEVVVSGGDGSGSANTLRHHGQFPAIRYPASLASAARSNKAHSIMWCNLAVIRAVWTVVDAELFCVTRSPQRAILAVLCATPTAGSVQNQPISLARLLVPFVPTLQGPHSPAHISDTTSTSSQSSSREGERAHPSRLLLPRVVIESLVDNFAVLPLRDRHLL